MVRCEKECNFDRTARSYCSLATYNANLPSYFQYFSGQPAVGGTNNLMDYCTAYTEYSNGYCDDSANGAGSTLFGETYAAGSRCFTSSLVQTGASIIYAATPLTRWRIDLICSRRLCAHRTEPRSEMLCNDLQQPGRHSFPFVVSITDLIVFCTLFVISVTEYSGCYSQRSDADMPRCRWRSHFYRLQWYLNLVNRYFGS